MTRDERIINNLALVETHFHSEAANEIEKALYLFTDDIHWESPTRNLLLRGKKETGDNYRKMFESFKVEGFRNLSRFATEDRVVDDSIITVELVGDGVINAPVPVGSTAEIRLLHVFDIREGKIAKELVFENWRLIRPAVDQFPYAVASSALGSPALSG